MTWIVLGLLVVVVLGIGALVRRRSRPTAPFPTPAPARRCRDCLGTGWIGGEPERTFNFVGDGFEDKHAPAVACPACGGTGTVAG